MGVHFIVLLYSLPKDMYYDHDLAENDRKKEEGALKKPQQSEKPLPPLSSLTSPPSLSPSLLFPLSLCPSLYTHVPYSPEYFKRVIVHPSFMNCSFTEAEKTLSKMDQGDAIFRPSSKVAYPSLYNNIILLIQGTCTCTLDEVFIALFGSRDQTASR